MTDQFADAVEREQLCDLMHELGPAAPTLLAPWTTHDLAAHLFTREHDHRAAPGLVVPGELLLYLFGRQDAAHVELSGPRDAVEAVSRARFGM